MANTPDLSDLMSKVQDMQGMLEGVQDKLKKFTVTGQAGGGLVKVVARGDFTIMESILSPDLKGESRDVVQDLITAAVNDALQKIQKYHEGEMGKLGSALGVPGGGFGGGQTGE